MPALVIRALFVVVGVLLTVVAYRPSNWYLFGFLFTVTAAVAPQYLVAWGLILFLAVGQLAFQPELSWRFLVLLAGLHLVHVLAMWLLGLPWQSRVQVALFRASLFRYLAIQIPVQLLAVLALLLLAPSRSGHRPLTIAGFAVVGAVALAGLTVLLVMPQRDPDQPPHLTDDP